MSHFSIESLCVAVTITLDCAEQAYNTGKQKPQS